jgi:hypothetical protein
MARETEERMEYSTKGTRNVFVVMKRVSWWWYALLNSGGEY